MLYKYSTSPDRYVRLKKYTRENRANMTEAERVLSYGYNFLCFTNVGVLLDMDNVVNMIEQYYK